MSDTTAVEGGLTVGIFGLNQVMVGIVGEKIAHTHISMSPASARMYATMLMLAADVIDERDGGGE